MIAINVSAGVSTPRVYEHCKLYKLHYGDEREVLGNSKWTLAGVFNKDII